MGDRSTGRLERVRQGVEGEKAKTAPVGLPGAPGMGGPG